MSKSQKITKIKNKITESDAKRIDAELESNKKSLDFIQKQIDVKLSQDIYEKSKISFDGKSLFIRLPAKIRDKFNVKQGQYMVFRAEVKNKKIEELKITIENATETK